MSKEILVQFVGFASNERSREYTFTVREGSTEPREYVVTISNEAFNDHRLRFQDAPDLCSIKLRHELAAHANHPVESRFYITDLELDDYRSSHSPRTPKKLYGRKPTDDF